jgi:hypothetical protein
MASKRRRTESIESVVPFEKRAGKFDVEAIRNFYDVNGYVVLRILTPAQCDEGIYELYEKLLMTQPWNDPDHFHGESPFVLKDDSGAIAFERDASEAHKRRVVEALKRRDIPGDELAKLEYHWTLHLTFGAPCDDIGFNLPRVWGVRQDPEIYEVVSALTRTRELHVDINRPIMKLPTRGEKEFLHWDLDLNVPFERVSRHVQGKVAYTASRFVGVPGTHTPEYQEYFLQKYGGPKEGVKKTALNERTHGEEFAKQRVFELPAGCCLFWNSQMLHGQMPTPRKANIELGFYLGYFPAEIERAVHEDRLRSYRHGVAPEFWPSGDKIHFYPKLWRCNYEHIERTIEKMPRGHPSISDRTNERGQVFPHLLPWRPRDYERTYVPPPLTPLGQKLLGLRSWREYTAVPLSRPIQAGEVVGTSRLVSAGALYTAEPERDGKSRSSAFLIDDD